MILEVTELRCCVVNLVDAAGRCWKVLDSLSLALTSVS
jgi:hypothetical protein